MRSATWICLSLFLVGTIGCMSMNVTMGYEATGLIDETRGKGAKVTLEVVDTRENPQRLGTTLDMYRQKINLRGSASQVVERSFRQALMNAGYVVVDDAPLKYRVRILELVAQWTQGIGMQAQCEIALNVEVESLGEVVGQRVDSGSGEEPIGLGSAGETEASRCLADATGKVVDRLVMSRALAEAIHASGGMQITVPASARPPRGFQALYDKRVAVVIGIDDYETWPALEGAKRDALRVAASLRELGFDEVIELHDSEATRSRILAALSEDLNSQVSEESLALIYFAGHGETETLRNG